MAGDELSKYEVKSDDLDKYAKKSGTGQPIADNTTIGPGTSTASKMGSALFTGEFPYVHPIDALKQATVPIESYSQEGRKENPTLARMGDITAGAKQLGDIVGPEIATLTLPDTAEGMMNIAREIPQGTRAVLNATSRMLREPATARQSQLGKPGTIKPMLPSMLQKYTIPDWMIPKGELGTPTRPGPFMEIPARMPKASAPVDEVAQAVREGRASKMPTRMPKASAPVDEVTQAVREGRASKMPTRMPKALPQGKPSPFMEIGEGTTTLPGKAPSSTMQPPARMPASSSPQPQVQFVSKFEKPEPEPSRIVSPESKPPHVEGSYWSFKEPNLRKAVLSGDRDAAIVYKERFGQLPEGAKFLTDVGDRPNRGLYQSR